MMYIEAIEFGFSPIPLNGKIPLIKSWNEKDNAFFLYSLEKHRGNIGIRTGRFSKIIILDCDKPRSNNANATDGNEDFNKIVLKETGKSFLDLPTVIDQSGSESYRFYFRYNPNIQYLSKIKNCNIDILSDKKQAVYVGSVYEGCCELGVNKHKCGTKDNNVCLYAGNKYKWIKSPADTEIMDVPSWLMKYITKEEPIERDRETLDSIDISVNESIELFKKLSPIRFTEYDSWRDLIWLMKKQNIPDIEIHKLSATAPNYSEEATDKLINEFDQTKNISTLGTLFHFLRIDMPNEEYNILTRPYIIERVLDKQIESLFELYETKFVKIQDIPSIVKYVQDIDFPNTPNQVRCIGIRMALGGGKTSALIRLVQSMNSNSKILVLSPRITYAKNICAEYNSRLDSTRQFVCYTKHKDSGKSLKGLNFEDRIVISMESLHYLESYTPDLLIIDEINANLIAHVSPETNGKNLDNNIYQFRRLLTYSKNVVVADAFLGPKCINFFTDLQIPLHIYNYTRKLEKRVAYCKKYLTDNKTTESTPIMNDEFFNQLKNLLEQKKKIYAFISTKNNIHSIEEQLKKTNFKYLIYSSDSLNEIPDNLNSGWNDLDLVGTTSTITVGCSHTDKYFDNILLSFSAYSNNYVSDAIQSHYRVRHINDNSIYVFTQDCSIAPNYPVNKQRLQRQFDNKEGWYINKFKGFQSTEIYIKNLILHNMFEHELSHRASTKMVHRYLQDCNYDIIDEYVELEKQKEEEKESEETKQSDDNIDIIEAFKKLKVCYKEAYRLETEKTRRKLTLEERQLLDDFWFLKIYSAKNDPHMKEYNEPVLALAYSIWKCKFKGDPILRQMRLEKKLLEGKITIEELAEKRFDKHSIAGLHSSDIRKIDRIVTICKALGLKHCNDTETIIPQSAIDDYYNICKGDYFIIQQDFKIEDQRKNKGNPTKRQFKGLLESTFTKSHSFCSLKVHSEHRSLVDGKRQRTRNYKLQLTNKTLKITLNDNIQHFPDPNNVPLELYNNLSLDDIEEEPRRLRPKV